MLMDYITEHYGNGLWFNCVVKNTFLLQTPPSSSFSLKSAKRQSNVDVYVVKYKILISFRENF